MPPHHLHSPTVAMIPRIGDAAGYLYLDRVRVTQDATGVAACTGSDVMYLPVADIAAILLGPGVSITTRAVSTIQRHNTVIVWVGDSGVRCYASTTSDTTSTTWLHAQTHAWANPTQRTAVAKRMYKTRFSDSIDVDQKTVTQLRGFEGSRMRQLYHVLAKQYGIKPFKRSYNPDDWNRQNPVNKALSAANTCLYGITKSAISVLGCSPSLGFIHTGKHASFVYDIADLYKAELTIPVAFSLHQSDNPESDARRSFREQLHLFGLMPRIVNDIKYIIDPQQSRKNTEPRGVTMLWGGEETNNVPAATNYDTKT